jgi:site-specific recombinase XerD
VPNAVPVAPTYLPAPHRVATLRDTLRSHRAEATEAAYARGWTDFAAWCAAENVAPLPASAETVSVFLRERAANLKMASVLLRLRAISVAHRRARQPNPTTDDLVHTVIDSLRRRAASDGQRTVKKAALRAPALRQTVAAMPATLIGARDRALLLIGFAGAFRRSELVALNVEDVIFSDEGALIAVHRSKTDVYGDGATIGVPAGRGATCPVRALRAWLAAANITTGAIFRNVDRHGRVSAARLSAQTVRLVVQRSVERVGLDPDAYGAHSLRHGFATSAAEAGAEERAIMRHGRWRSVTVARSYIAEGLVWRDNPLAYVGL